MDMYKTLFCVILLLAEFARNIEAQLMRPIQGVYNQIRPINPSLGRQVVPMRNPYIVNYNNGRGRLPVIPQYPRPVYPQPHLNIIPTKPPDYDQITAQQYPEATKLLERLKELNRLKDEQKKKELEDQMKKENEHNNDKGKDDSFEKGDNTPDEEDDGPLVMKKIIKRKFYYQAQAVRPENEIKRDKETIYYIDK